MATDSLSVSPPNAKPASLHDSARGSPEPLALPDFDSLVHDINKILGPSNGISSADIDVAELKDAMRCYDSHEGGWEKYAFGDQSRAYTRNLVDNCNGKSNLLVLVWTPGKGSPIHDHANAHCVMKILKGQLRETLYNWPCQTSSTTTTSTESSCPSTDHTCSVDRTLEPEALHVKRSTTYGADEVTYMSDRLGLHRMENPSEDEVAVSLHLYTPPNAAKHGCRVFDAETGKSSRVSQCHFFSEFGVKM